MLYLTQKQQSENKLSKNFTQVPNEVIQNPNLSLKAKGLYSLILSYVNINNFDIHKPFLIDQSLEGEKAFNSAWKELKDAGLLKQYRIPHPDKKGKFTYEYELLIEADTSNDGTINCRVTGEVITENKGIQAYTPKRTLCSKDNVPNGICNNNTNLKNNNSNNDISSSALNEESDLNTVMECCKKFNYKLSKEKAQDILRVYDYTKIIKAITHISMLNVKIKNYAAYLLAVLKDMSTSKVVNVNVSKKIDNNNVTSDSIDPLSFNNFKPREYDYDDLEAKLLGWA